MMRIIHSIAAILVSGFLAASPAFAQERVPDTIRLKDGSTLKGYATAYDDNAKVLTFRTEDGKDRRLTLADLNTLSVYQVTQSTIPKDNAKAQLQLANYARDTGLYAHALRHYGYAEKADPSLKGEIDKERAVLRQKAADFALANARAALAKGDHREAKSWLTKIIEKLPDEPQAAEASKLLQEMLSIEKVDTQLARTRENQQDLESDLARSKKLYEDMQRKTRDGLTSRSGGTQATNTWQSALDDGERGLKEIDKLEKKYTDPRSREVLASYRSAFTAQMVELRLHRASVWTTRSSYNRALDEVNQALALDPKNQQALEARSRIEVASSRGFGWWY
jgi:tetratricopeptide (TPR) repeat protein